MRLLMAADDARVLRVPLRPWKELEAWPPRLRPRKVWLRATGIVFEYPMKSGAPTELELAPRTRGGNTPVLELVAHQSSLPAKPLAALAQAVSRQLAALQPETVAAIEKGGSVVAFLQAREREAGHDGAWVSALRELSEAGGVLAAEVEVSKRALHLPWLVEQIRCGNFDAAFRACSVRESDADALDAGQLDQVARALRLTFMGRGVEARERLAEQAREQSLVSCDITSQLASLLGDEELAFELARRTVRVGSAGSLRGVAALALEAHAYPWAAEAARRALELVGTSEPWWVELVDMLIAAGAIAEAKATLSELLERAGNDLAARERLRLELAELALLQRRHDEVQQLLEGVSSAELEPRRQRLLGAALVDQRRWAEAASVLQSAIHEDEEARLWLGEAYLRQGDVDRAREAIRLYDAGESPIKKLLWGLTEVALVEKDEDNRHHLDVAYYHRNVARDLLGSPIGDELSPREEAALLWKALARCGTSRRLQLTLPTEDGGFRPAPDVTDPRTPIVAAQHRVRFETPDSVVAKIQAMGRERPDVPYTLTYSAEVELWRGDYERALAGFTRAWEQYQTRWAYVGAGAACAMLGRDEEALAWWDRGQQTFRELIDGEATHLLRGEVYRRSGRDDEALEQLEYAVRVRPTRVSAWLNLALLHLQAGRQEQGAAACERVVEACPWIVWEAHRALGLEPHSDPLPEHRRPVLEQCLESMAGNRSSYLVTFYDVTGVWRVLPCAFFREHWQRVAQRIERRSYDLVLEELMNALLQHS